MADEPLHLIHLTVENFMGLKIAKVPFDGKTVTIEGPNGAGKSSLLNSITCALGGARYRPANTVRRGSEEAVVEVDLGQLGVPVDVAVKYRVRVVMRDDKPHRVKVTSADGLTYPSPQSLLASLVGDLTFDVSEFVRMAPAEQCATLLRLAGLDLSDVDAREGDAFSRRTDAGRRLRDLEARLAATPEDPNAPTAEVSARDVSAALVTAREAAREVQAATTAAEAAARAAMAAADEMPPEPKVVEDVETSVLREARNQARDRAAERERLVVRRDEVVAEIDRLKAGLAKIDADVARVDAEAETHGTPELLDARLDAALIRDEYLLAMKVRDEVAGDLAAAVGRLKAALDAATAAGDPAEVEARLATIEADNARARAAAGRAALVAEVEAARRQHEELDEAVEAARTERQRRLSAAQMPLDGLSVAAGVVTYRDLPLSQASEAETYRVAAAIGMALNPALRLLLVRNGSLMDQRTLRSLAEQAAECGYQVLVERVAEPMEIDEDGARIPRDGVGIVIEEGEVVQGGEVENKGQ